MISPRTIERLVREHASALELFASGWTRSPEDPVQEAFIELSMLPNLPENVAAWLFRVVRNKAISDFRSKKRRRQREQVVGEIRLRVAQEHRATPPAVAVGEIAAAVEQLSTQQREVVVAKIWGKLTFEQVADVFGISTSAAHRRYTAGLESLRYKLGLQWINKTNETKSKTC